MKKSVGALIVVLIVLVVLLLVANVFLILRSDSSLLFSRHSQKPVLEQPVQEAEKSIGEQTAEAVGQFHSQGMESMKIVEAQNQKTAEELEKTRQELEKLTAQTVQTYGEQFNQMAIEFSKTAQLTLESLNQEIQRFNETLKKQQEQRQKV